MVYYYVIAKTEEFFIYFYLFLAINVLVLCLEV